MKNTQMEINIIGKGSDVYKKIKIYNTTNIMIFNCKSCNYETRDKSNFTKHQKTSKHVENIQKNIIDNDVIHKTIQNNSKNTDVDCNKNKKYVCNSCSKSFAHRQGLHKHKKNHCPNVNKKSDDKPMTNQDNIIIQLQTQMANVITKCEKLEKTNKKIKRTNTGLKKTNIELKETNDKLIDIIQSQLKSTQKTNEQLADTIQSQSKSVEKSINTLSFVSTQYPNAPPIKTLENDQFNEMTERIMFNKKNDEILEEILLTHYKGHKLHAILGDIIVNEYKKDNPKNQSLWVSDVSRLTFIIKNLIKKTNKSKWISDKNGTCLTKFIIDPMLKIIRKKIIRYGKSIMEHDPNDTIDNGRQKIINLRYAVDLQKSIELKKIHSKILRYVAPHFNLNINQTIDSNIDDSNDSDSNDSNSNDSTSNDFTSNDSDSNDSDSNDSDSNDSDSNDSTSNDSGSNDSDSNDSTSNDSNY